MKFLRVTVLLLCIVSSVAKGAEIADMLRSNPVEHSDRYNLQKEKSRPPSFYEVGIETTGCMTGDCPEFVIILQNQGSVYYHGIANTKKGYFVGEDGRNVNLISELLETMDLQSYADRYTVDVSEQGATYLYIKTRSGTKVIRDSSFLTPLKLRLLEELIINSINGVKLKRHNWSKEER